MRIKLNSRLYPSYNSKNLSDICETLSKQTVNPDGFEEFDIVDIHILVLLVTKVHAVHIRVIKTPLLYKFIRTWLKCKVYISMPSALTSTMLMEILLHLCHFCLYICICIWNSHYSMFLMCSSRQIYIKCIIDWIVECLQFYSRSVFLVRSIDTGTISSMFLKQLKIGWC